LEIGFVAVVLSYCAGRFGLIGFGMYQTLSRQHAVAREVAALQQDISTYRTKQQDLQRLLKYFTTPEYGEREARLRLGLQKPGEQVVVIPNLTSNQNGAASAAENSDQPNWRLWLAYFFGGGGS